MDAAGTRVEVAVWDVSDGILETDGDVAGVAPVASAPRASPAAEADTSEGTLSARVASTATGAGSDASTDGLGVATGTSGS